MFLDDELFQMVKNADCSTTENIQQLNVDLCTKCESYYKSKIYPGITKKEVKAVMDRTFNLWNSFINMIFKDSDNRLKLLGELFQTYSFKSQLLSNPEMRRIYESL